MEAATLAAAFNATQSLLRQRRISAGHDISDGGVAVALLEMAFAGNTGIQVSSALQHHLNSITRGGDSGSTRTFGLMDCSLCRVC